MKIKTKGKCTKCGEAYSPNKAGTHLLECISQSITPSRSTTEGYLIRIASEEHLTLYWMFVTVPKDSPLKLLDQFLRDIWLECCCHLSQFTIGTRRYISHTESGNPSQFMERKINQALSLGEKFTYVYDFGSSTNLELEIIESVAACPSKKVTLLIQNDPPNFPCESCKQAADIVCSFCSDTTCSDCSKNHSCAVKEDDTYMMMPLVNSPRTGVCGYEGRS